MADADVYIIDDDPAVRDSLAFLCTSGGYRAEVFEAPSSFLDAASDLIRGCVLTDVRMPQMDGVSLIRLLREQGFNLPIVVMTGHGDVALAVAAMKAGAVDFLEKPFDDEVMLAAIRTALRTEQTARPDGESSEKSVVDIRLEMLSEREKQVLHGLLEGQANKVIAIELGISPRTVEIYRAKVMAKMEAGSLAELIRMVVSKTSA